MRLESKIETAARREALALMEHMAQRDIAPLVAANAGAMVSAAIFALGADNLAQIEIALNALANVARLHAFDCFSSRKRQTRQ
jgi:hypothetical protein